MGHQEGEKVCPGSLGWKMPPAADGELYSPPLLPKTLPSSQLTGQKISLQKLALLSEGQSQL